MSCLGHCVRHLFLRRPHKRSPKHIEQTTLLSCDSEIVRQKMSGFAQQTTANHSDKQQSEKQRESKRDHLCGLASDLASGLASGHTWVLLGNAAVNAAAKRPKPHLVLVLQRVELPWVE